MCLSCTCLTPTVRTVSRGNTTPLKLSQQGGEQSHSSKERHTLFVSREGALTAQHLKTVQSHSHTFGQSMRPLFQMNCQLYWQLGHLNRKLVRQISVAGNLEVSVLAASQLMIECVVMFTSLPACLTLTPPVQLRWHSSHASWTFQSSLPLTATRGSPWITISTP